MEQMDTKKLPFDFTMRLILNFEGRLYNSAGVSLITDSIVSRKLAIRSFRTVVC